MMILESVQNNFPAIDKAARDFLGKLSMVGINTDIALAAEMAGLALLRTSKADLSKAAPGMGVLGAIPESATGAVHQFISIWSQLNKLPPPTSADFAALPEQDKRYHPELTQFEQPFYDVCAKHAVARELYPFVAATTALLLVLSGQVLKLLDVKAGQAMVGFHFVSGCKIMPYPLTR